MKCEQCRRNACATAGGTPCRGASVRWVLREAGRADVTRQEHITINIASPDSANIASGFSQALAGLADRMATGL